MSSTLRSILTTTLLMGAAVAGGAWVGSMIAGVPFSWDLAKPYIGQTSPITEALRAQNQGAYAPRSEAGALLVAQQAERESDWPVTHNALRLLNQNTQLPPDQIARLFLSAIAQNDWATAQKVLQTNPDIIAQSAPLVPMVAAIMEFADNNQAAAAKRIRTVGYNPISQPLLPFVTAWISRETPQIGLIEAAQDIGFTSINLVRYWEATKQYDRADALMKKLQEADLNVRLRTWSVAYFKRRQMDAEAKKAQTELDDILKAYPGAFWTMEQKRVETYADAHLRNDKTALALTLLDATDFLVSNNASAIALLYAQLAGKLAPDLDAVAMTRGSIYEDQQNWEQAVTAYQSIDSKSPASLIARLRISNVYTLSEQYDKARIAFDSITRDYPDDAEAWYEKAEFLRAGLKDYNAAIKAYDKAITLMGKDVPETYWSTYLARGLCYEFTNRPDEAIKNYQKAIDLQPNHPEALNTLAYAWAEKGINLDEAEKMTLKALAQDPQAPHILDTLGWIFFKKKEMGKALPLLEHAASMMAYDATVNSHLGDVYEALGRHREAIYMWQRALDAADNDRDRAALRKKLGQ